MKKSGAKVVIVAILKARAGAEDQLASLLKELAAQVHKNEPGCYEYTPVQVRNDKTEFLVIERYADLDAAQKHG